MPQPQPKRVRRVELSEEWPRLDQGVWVYQINKKGRRFR